MSAVVGLVLDGHLTPGQRLELAIEGRLVAFDDTDVRGLLDGDQVLRVLPLRVQRVRGHHRPGQVEPVQQRPERGDFVGLAVDLDLGQHRLAGVVHSGQQVHLRAGWSATA